MTVFSQLSVRDELDRPWASISSSHLLVAWWSSREIQVAVRPQSHDDYHLLALQSYPVFSALAVTPSCETDTEVRVPSGAKTPEC